MRRMTELTGHKPPWRSLGVLGGCVSIMSGLQGIAGVTASDPAQEQILGTVPLVDALYLYVLAVVGGVVSIIGRVRASKRIGW